MVEIKHEDTSASSSSEDEQGNFTANFQNKVESSNHWHRIQALARVASILTVPYLNEPRRPIDQLDKKLIKGFYRRTLNEYKYLEVTKRKDALDD